MSARAAVAAAVLIVVAGLAGAMIGWLVPSVRAGVDAVTVIGAGDGRLLPIVAANGRFVLVLIIAGLAVTWVPGWRVPLDVAVAGLVGFNASVVGAVIGAHGARLLPALPHLPLEAAGFVVGLAGYLDARQRRCGWGVSRAGATAALLVGAGALVEWRISPGVA